MNLKEKYKDDIALIMNKINHNGGELWTTNDRKIILLYRPLILKTNKPHKNTTYAKTNFY